MSRPRHTRFRLLAIDVDGTLVGPDSCVPPQMVAALAEARAAGLLVVLATGRSYVETAGVWRQLRFAKPHQPLVLVGGALVSEPVSGRTLRYRCIPRDLACEFDDALAEARLSTMALVDGWRHGLDYFVTDRGGGVADGGWFRETNARVRSVPRLADARGMPDPLRVSAIAEPTAARELAPRLLERFRGQLNVHAILAPNYGVTIVEAHAAGADKMAGILYVAQSRRIGPSQIAAVGDDINDAPMLRGAGLGVAVAQAAEGAREAADRVLDADREEAGGTLARFVQALLRGEYDAAVDQERL